MHRWHIAQLNVGRALAPPGSPELADFMAALDRINALAESSPDSRGACSHRAATPPTSWCRKIRDF